ncbi:MAG: ABC transporter substrate-binding protein [Chloroflexi bacterium]|nr:ABC transporter substrate-binding protein [Chloroflexota bacterium]MBV9546256.1 ABC transporter substrate-binding protein [Chloroflexota bacterium]
MGQYEHTRLTRRAALTQTLGLFGIGLLAACSAPPPATAPAQQAPATVAPTAAAPATQAPAAAATSAPAAAATSAPAAASGTPKRGGTFTFGTGQGFTTLDPHKPGLLNDQNVHHGIFDGLVRMNEAMEPQPALAESWQVVDPQTYVFKLRQGVKFHNGRDLTADDVKFTLDRVADSATGSRWASFSLPQYDHSEVVDANTVKLVNKSPFAPQIDGLAKVMIVAKENAADVGTNPIGTGPFQFGEYVQDDHLTIKRFADYWDKDHVYLDQVVLKTIKDATAVVQALKTGGVDSVWQLSTPHADEVSKDPNLALYHGPKNAVVQMLMIDNNQPPFNDVRVRQALSYATDRKSINEVAFYGQFLQHDYDVPLPEDNWAFNQSLAKAEYDLTKAKQLFDAAGVTSDTTLTFQAISTANPEWVTTGEIMQQSLQKIGLKVNIEKLDLAAWAAIFAPPQDKQWAARIISNGNVGYSDPFFFLVTLQSNSSTNFNHYKNVQVDDLLAKAQTTLDKDQRMSLYAQAQEMIAKDVPCPLPYTQVGLYGVTKALKGFYAEADWVPHFENAWLDR